jgi:hypothetical protein
MHIELLVEDSSGKTTLDTLLPKLVGPHDTFRVHPYKGIGRIPRSMKDADDPSKRILLTNLPRLLRGYGRTFQGYTKTYKAAVVLVCDLDDKDPDHFLGELKAVLNACSPRPETRFCIAIEEGEAWFLGDVPAVLKAYPHADSAVIGSYENDSICGTWEKLADAIYPGGAKALVKRGWQSIGAEKQRWAENITPNMKIDSNASRSFCFFRDQVRDLVSGKTQLPKAKA